jgi:hypothetical protein
MTQMATRDHSDADVRHKVLGHVILTLRIFESESEDCRYESECVELDVGSCGATIGEAIDNISDATVQYLNAIEESGDIERIFRKRHIPIILGEPREQARSVVAQPNDWVQVFLYRMMIDVPTTGLTTPPHAKTASM